MHGGGGAEYPLERSGSSSSASGGKLHAIVEDAAAGSAAIREAGNGAAGQQDTRSRSAPARPTGGGDELAEPDHMILGLSKVHAARLSSNENDTVYIDGGVSDICETELSSCIAALRQIDAGEMDSAAVNVALAAVLRRLEDSGDDLTSPVLKVTDREHPVGLGMGTANLSLVNEYGLKAKLTKFPPADHDPDRDGAAPVSWAAGKELYAPISAEHSFDGLQNPGRRLSEGSSSFEKKFGKSLEDSWNLSLPDSPSMAEQYQVALPKSPAGSGYGSGYRSPGVPKWQQGMDQVVVDSVELAQWEFDPFKATKVDPALNGQDLHDDHTISAVPFALRMLADHHLFDELDIETDCMKRYLRRVERDYQRNPYHNRVHGFDVMQTCHCVLMQSPALRGQLSAIDKLALLVGAFVHDVGHPGVNNKLLAKLAEQPDCHLSRDLKSRDKCRQLAQFAITYNSKSVLESFHISRAFQLAFDTRESNANPFHKMPHDDFAKLRSLMVSLVLATDMENHFSLVTKMKHLAADASGNPRLLDLHDDTEKETLLKAIMHGCDVGNPTKPIALAGMWTDVISEEFWTQGEFEIELGFKPERMLERQDTTTNHGRFAQAQGQLAFIKYIVKPLHDVLATQLPIFGEKSVKNLSDVVGHWEKILHENTAEDPIAE